MASLLQHEMQADVADGSILLKKDFEGTTSATLIQGERRTSNINSKIHLLGFDCFTIQFHRSILDTFSTVSVNRYRSGADQCPLCVPYSDVADPWIFTYNRRRLGSSQDATEDCPK